MKNILVAAVVLAMICTNSAAQSSTNSDIDYMPAFHGTIRAKYEYQTSEGKGRFEVRNARLSANGNVAKNVGYKAEVDLSDEGKIKMLDAFAALKLADNLQLTAGQFRVPFTIDAHRSPHKQYFANRSFIAKQMGSVRDVGAALAYETGEKFHVKLEAGLFNGTGITNQQNNWTKTVNYSVKAAFELKNGRDLFNLTLSSQKQRPASVTVLMYDAGAYYQSKRLHIEAEYMYKHFSGNTFADAHAVDVFASYDIPLRKAFFSKISPLVRFDCMTDNSDAEVFTDDTEKRLALSDYKRSRLTGGATFSVNKPFVADIRVNFEKYFYRKNSQPAVSEKDKLVVELMTHF